MLNDKDRPGSSSGWSTGPPRHGKSSAAHGLATNKWLTLADQRSAARLVQKGRLRSACRSAAFWEWGTTIIPSRGLCCDTTRTREATLSIWVDLNLRMRRPIWPGPAQPGVMKIAKLEFTGSTAQTRTGVTPGNNHCWRREEFAATRELLWWSPLRLAAKAAITDPRSETSKLDAGQQTEKLSRSSGRLRNPPLSSQTAMSRLLAHEGARNDHWRTGQSRAKAA
jgi:hypothetical protein